ncbi:phytanoyl-CoA dioxygenase family protein [Streptomyces sp. NPDC056296]|uniref:phytanoyl-CoA dioxygenase family protein n=1 Tax=Streptomyces sp. NPDC056296 TaxID=3345775 RepID=UPI0035E2651E
MLTTDAASLEYDKLGPEVTRAFAENGVVCLRGLLDEKTLAALREGVEVAINEAHAERSGPAATYIKATRLWTRHEGFRDFAFGSRIAEAAAVVMGSRVVRMYNDSMFVKEPSAPEPTPWHQDLPYFLIDGLNLCSAWIPLDPANEASGAMSYGLGSHRWGKLYRPEAFEDPGTYRSGESYDGPAPDLDADPERYPTVAFATKPGDVVFHHLRTLHKAGPNSTEGTRRRVHTVRFAGDDTTWINRPFSTVEFKTRLDDGDALAGEDFPVLWPR